MQERGVEPLHLSVQDPKSCASANSATPAHNPIKHQPPNRVGHRSFMRFHISAIVGPVAAGLILTAGMACSPNQTPDQIRQQTAQATEDVKRDTKAVAEGIREGLSNKKTIDLNKASKDDLLTLPGVTSPRADRIIAERPYASAHQLVTRHVVSEDEYAQIQDRIVVTR